MIRVFKYHGLENDFVVYDRRGDQPALTVEDAIHLCHRRRGIGADGVLILEPSPVATARMTVFNADGSTAEMCGNGVRCAAKYLADQLGSRPPGVEVETLAGVLGCGVRYGADGKATSIDVEMGRAHLSSANLPSTAPWVDAPLPGFPDLRGTAVSMGNPHLVLSNADPDDVERLGPMLERHPDFPDRVNVELVRQQGQGLVVNVWERGSGFTRACGTGACAAAAAWVRRGLLPSETWLPVDLPGGRLEIRVAQDLSGVRMRGPAVLTFEALVALPTAS